MNDLSLSLSLLFAFAPPPTCPRADMIVQRLGHDDYATRQRAEEALRKLGVSVMPSLRRGVSDRDVEIRARCQRLADAAVEAEIAGYGVLPWIDSAWMAPDRVAYASGMDDTPEGERCRAYGGHLANPSGEDDWASYRAATRSLVTDWLRDGMPRWWIDANLTHMRRNDLRWKAGRGEPEMIPPPAPN